MVPLGPSRLDPIHDDGRCAGDHELPPWLPDDCALLLLAPHRRAVLRLDGGLHRHPLNHHHDLRCVHVPRPGRHADQRRLAAHGPRFLPRSRLRDPRRRGQVCGPHMRRHRQGLRSGLGVLWHPGERADADRDHHRHYVCRHALRYLGREPGHREPLPLHLLLGHGLVVDGDVPGRDVLLPRRHRADLRLLHVVHFEGRLPHGRL
mmetsp:Transcript_65820/g.190700  ORF Transcript_65820/g.190700 Transcript_65820/m.190700 type:complete len:205 (-) Transcript_65820:618-1232(-)